MSSYPYNNTQYGMPPDSSTSPGGNSYQQHSQQQHYSEQHPMAAQQFGHGKLAPQQHQPYQQLSATNIPPPSYPPYASEWNAQEPHAALFSGPGYTPAYAQDQHSSDAPPQQYYSTAATPASAPMSADSTTIDSEGDASAEKPRNPSMSGSEMEFQILVKNAPEETTEDDIRRFFKSRMIPTGGIQFTGGKNNNVYVSFGNKNDLLEAHQLAGTMMTLKHTGAKWPARLYIVPKEKVKQTLVKKKEVSPPAPDVNQPIEEAVDTQNVPKTIFDERKLRHDLDALNEENVKAILQARYDAQNAPIAARKQPSALTKKTEPSKALGPDGTGSDMEWEDTADAGNIHTTVSSAPTHNRPPGAPSVGGPAIEGPAIGEPFNQHPNPPKSGPARSYPLMGPESSYPPMSQKSSFPPMDTESFHSQSGSDGLYESMHRPHSTAQYCTSSAPTSEFYHRGPSASSVPRRPVSAAYPVQEQSTSRPPQHQQDTSIPAPPVEEYYGTGSTPTDVPYVSRQSSSSIPQPPLLPHRPVLPERNTSSLAYPLPQPRTRHESNTSSTLPPPEDDDAIPLPPSSNRFLQGGGVDESSQGEPLPGNGFFVLIQNLCPTLTREYMLDYFRRRQIYPYSMLFRRYAGKKCSSAFIHFEKTSIKVRTLVLSFNRRQLGSREILLEEVNETVFREALSYRDKEGQHVPSEGFYMKVNNIDPALSEEYMIEFVNRYDVRVEAMIFKKQEGKYSIAYMWFVDMDKKQIVQGLDNTMAAGGKVSFKEIDQGTFQTVLQSYKPGIFKEKRDKVHVLVQNIHPRLDEQCLIDFFRSKDLEVKSVVLRRKNIGQNSVAYMAFGNSEMKNTLMGLSGQSLTPGSNPIQITEINIKMIETMSRLMQEERKETVEKETVEKETEKPPLPTKREARPPSPPIPYHGRMRSASPSRAPYKHVRSPSPSPYNKPAYVHEESPSQKSGARQSSSRDYHQSRVERTSREVYARPPSPPDPMEPPLTEREFTHRTKRVPLDHRREEPPYLPAERSRSGRRRSRESPDQEVMIVQHSSRRISEHSDIVERFTRRGHSRERSVDELSYHSAQSIGSGGRPRSPTSSGTERLSRKSHRTSSSTQSWKPSDRGRVDSPSPTREPTPPQSGRHFRQHPSRRPRSRSSSPHVSPHTTVSGKSDHYGARPRLHQRSPSPADDSCRYSTTTTTSSRSHPKRPPSPPDYPLRRARTTRRSRSPEYVSARSWPRRSPSRSQRSPSPPRGSHFSVYQREQSSYHSPPRQPRSRSPVGRSRSPVGRPRSPVGRPRSPAGRPRSLAGRPRSPAGRPRSPAGRPRSPAGRPRSPFGRPRSPAGRPRSPAGRPRSPAGRPRSPAGRPRSPAGRPRSPVGRPRSPVGRPRSPVGRPRSPIGRSGSPLGIRSRSYRERSRPERSSSGRYREPVQYRPRSPPSSWQY